MAARETFAIKLSVSGMKCNGCIAKATEALAKLPGYVAAEFDLKAGTAVVRGGVDPQVAIDALTSAGYPASLKNR
ncbi:MAG: heavy metal-associated domain-containing protein [Pseudomonadota bacterium]|jgi:copper chaperone CopZ